MSGDHFRSGASGLGSFYRMGVVFCHGCYAFRVQKDRSRGFPGNAAGRRLHMAYGGSGRYYFRYAEHDDLRSHYSILTDVLLKDPCFFCESSGV